MSTAVVTGCRRQPYESAATPSASGMQHAFDVPRVD